MCATKKKIVVRKPETHTYKRIPKVLRSSMTGLIRFTVLYVYGSVVDNYQWILMYSSIKEVSKLTVSKATNLLAGLTSGLFMPFILWYRPHALHR